MIAAQNHDELTALNIRIAGMEKRFAAAHA